MINARFLASAALALTHAVARLRDRSGVSAVEFAILAPVLIALPVPIIDLGAGLYAQMELEHAVDAGAQYALLHAASTPLPTAQISYATSASTPLSVTTNVSQSCGCPTGNLIIAGPCNNTCPDGEAIKTYVTITGATTYTTLLTYPMLGSSVALTAQSLVRIH